MRRNGGIPWSALALVLTVRSGGMAVEPVQMTGRVAIVKGGKLVKFVAGPSAPGGSFVLPAADPTVDGGRLTFVDVDHAVGNDVLYDLPVQPAPLGWKGLGTPPGARGYRYRGAGNASDPCRIVLLRRKVVKAVCRGAGVTLTTPAAGTLAVVLTIGADGDRYCAAFGGTEVKNDSLLKRLDATPPAACTCANVPPKELRFASGVPSGPCGALTTNSGSVDLDCGILYFGGGQVGTPPFVVADMVDPTTLSVDCCSGETLILGPLSESTTGTPKRCTRKGCMFGPPLVVPNASSTPQSVCVYPVYEEDARGVARCDTGDVRITLPIVGEAYLTGDILVRRCSGGTNPGLRCTTDPDCPGGGTCVIDPDLQPCPICNPQTGVCNGGRDNGMSCVPGNAAVVGIPFPTSRDCRVSPLLKVGDIPLPLSLTTGTSSRTAFASSGQSRVFCGFCRDGDDTLGFEVGSGNGVPCTSDAQCEQPFESCQQRSSGAFFVPANTIAAFGAPAGNLEDFAGHAATLVSVFCLPPTFVPIIDAPSDLPGPGAASFPGTLQLGSPGGAFLDAG